jgi:hypothetical protein
VTHTHTESHSEREYYRGYVSIVARISIWANEQTGGEKEKKIKRRERERERKGMFGILMKSTTHTHVQVDRVPTLDKLITKQKMNTHRIGDEISKGKKNKFPNSNI